MRTPYLIHGAGAVGSAMGAYLARAGHPVTLVARAPHAEAIGARGGLTLVSYEETFLAPVKARVFPPEDLPPDTKIFLTVQAPDVSEALKSLGALTAGHPVVTWQNGIRSEAEASPHCSHLYGGIVRFTSTLLDPGEVRVRRPGQLIVGRHPHGIDDVARTIVDDLNRAGFTAAVTEDIASDKALKLLVNLVSGPPVLIKRTGRCPELALVQTRILEEAGAVFRAAGIRADPVSGLGLSLDAMLERFRQGGSAPDGRPVFNSTWQNLYHRRPRLENAAYHGEVIRLGEAHGIATPVNRRALDLLESVREKGLGPEPFSLEEFRSQFADVVDFDLAPYKAPPPTSSSLEI